ncbi:SDR family oxidoreductase [Hoeflea prorocentri]|uniref:SDR family oxidoreductase n=1 Tax=Hoeflea prorocentri TaxID=1922333 RepID=A0A9X3ZK07_9HYPH|nr:SDR family oxidoreductase [Hoeflea prorocentri]MCY6383653.1 SDR family oxidoreductase [Hoeflea prorocentri]MDA5401453.1 SDR family oxidoreductase [Hoeflea prorocentri]
MPDQKNILVTGCSSGIGAYCARALRNDGWRVFATARKAEDIEALKQDGFEAFYLDYREPESIATLTSDVLEATGGTLDALFNNGAYGQAGAVEDLSTDVLREQFEANFFGWHELTRRIVPVMRNKGHGRIVQCSSILGLVPLRFRGAYNASKFALEGLSVTLRHELAGTDIHLSLIEPGPIESKFATNALAYVERYIDVEGSVHRDDYQKELQRLRQGGVRSRTKLKPDAVYAVLKHALESRRPRPHYVITRPARIATLMKRLLPTSVFYGLIEKR